MPNERNEGARAKYLLPCQCGRKIPIEPRQAGETIACECGKQFDAPSMLEIRALEPAPLETAAQPPTQAWGWRQLVKLLGMICLLAAAVSWSLLKPPVSIFQTRPPEEIKRIAGSMPPVETWAQWQLAKRGLDRRTDQKYTAMLTRYRIWQTLLIYLPALTGVGLIVLGFLPMRPSPTND